MKRIQIINGVIVLVTGITLIGSYLHQVTNQTDITGMLYNTTTQNLKDVTTSATRENQEIILNLLQKELPKEQQVLFRTCYVSKDGKQLHVEALYDSDILERQLSLNGIYDIDSFNTFLKTVDFDPSPILHSPIMLLENKKGNCYAHTLLTMYFIDKYYPEIDYEVITDVNNTGEPHIYLKLKSVKEEIVCDLTINPVLKLPNQ